MVEQEEHKDLDWLVRKLYAPVDHASATFFRIAWGALAALWAWDYLSHGRVTYMYVEPKFHFTFLGFDWVQPWPGIWMYVHFWALLLLAIAIAFGFFYRLACVLFAVGFTYVFLLDQANYQNHYYLILLVSWSICFLPLHRGLSWDARRNKKLAQDTIPSWVLFCLRIHVAIPYFYGGIAKLIPDWMMGRPMDMMLKSKADLPLFGSYFESPSAGLTFAWLGLLFDLMIVPALLWKPTRKLAYLSCLAFHLSNSVLFDIHIFPWLMIAASTIFFAPDWPRQLLGGRAVELADSRVRSWGELAWKSKLTFALASLYLCFHLLWPLRHNLYPGDPSWTEQGHFFSWRMMLRGKSGGVRYFVTDPEAQETFIPDLREFFNEEQAGKFPRNPEWVLHFAHYLDDYYSEKRGTDVEVRALVLLSLNGRKPQLIIDPNRDLSEVDRGQRIRDWVVPLKEPYTRVPWDLPLLQWESQVEIPKLEFLAQNPIVNFRQSQNTARDLSDPLSSAGGS